MSLFENFPYTNLHELNLDWLINTLNDLKDTQVISVNGMTGEVVLYENAIVQFPSLANNENWSLIRLVNGTQRGIAFGTDNKAYIVHGNQMGEVYTAGNQPPYPVTRVNGMTGDITLYSDSYVQLPTLTDAQLHNWTIFRNLNSVARGIQINDDGTLAIIAGNNRYTIYSENNPPFTDINGTITFDPVDNPNLEGWIIKRVINNTPVYIQLNDTGTLNFGVGQNFYKVYTTADTADDVIEIPTDTTGSSWGLIRETTEGSVGILFNNNPLLTEPSAYIRYVDSNEVVHTEKLLTQSDIPSSSGVVSVNGYTGVVSLFGSDIQVSSTDTRDVDEAIGDLTTTDSSIKTCIAYLENTNNASQNIPANSLVIWQNFPYVSNQAIASGTPLSSSNLDIISSGGFTNYLYNIVHDMRFAFKNDADDLNELKSDLISFAQNGVERLEERPYTFWASSGFAPFTAGMTYMGFVAVSGKSATSLRFSVLFYGDNGDMILMGYNNGAWVIKQVQATTI